MFLVEVSHSIRGFVTPTGYEEPRFDSAIAGGQLVYGC